MKTGTAKMLRKSYITLFSAAAATLMLSSCTKNENSPGVEYMPDMYRSPAIEAYVDYGMDPWLIGEDAAEAQRNVLSARKPVAGTIAYSGTENTELAMPYPFFNTPEDYDRAGAEWTSPLPVTKANLDAGYSVFLRFCIHCHGEAGEGNGSMTEVSGGKYPVVPSYQSRANIKDGNMYHTLMYGKGLMGSHASQISAQERWQVIQYVRTLMTGVTPEFDESGMVKPAMAADQAMTASN
jgi:mono/diheme cytochrome c family protein